MSNSPPPVAGGPPTRRERVPPPPTTAAPPYYPPHDHPSYSRHPSHGFMYDPVGAPPVPPTVGGPLSSDPYLHHHPRPHPAHYYAHPAHRMPPGPIPGPGRSRHHPGYGYPDPGHPGPPGMMPLSMPPQFPMVGVPLGSRPLGHTHTHTRRHERIYGGRKRKRSSRSRERERERASASREHASTSPATPPLRRHSMSPSPKKNVKANSNSVSVSSVSVPAVSSSVVSGIVESGDRNRTRDRDQDRSSKKLKRKKKRKSKKKKKKNAVVLGSDGSTTVGRGLGATGDLLVGRRKRSRKKSRRRKKSGGRKASKAYSTSSSDVSDSLSDTENPTSAGPGTGSVQPGGTWRTRVLLSDSDEDEDGNSSGLPPSKRRRIDPSLSVKPAPTKSAVSVSSEANGPVGRPPPLDVPPPLSQQQQQQSELLDSSQIASPAVNSPMTFSEAGSTSSHGRRFPREGARHEQETRVPADPRLSTTQFDPSSAPNSVRLLVPMFVHCGEWYNTLVPSLVELQHLMTCGSRPILYSVEPADLPLIQERFAGRIRHVFSLPSNMEKPRFWVFLLMSMRDLAPPGYVPSQEDVVEFSDRQSSKDDKDEAGLVRRVMMRPRDPFFLRRSVAVEGGVLPALPQTVVVDPHVCHVARVMEDMGIDARQIDHDINLILNFSAPPESREPLASATSLAPLPEPTPSGQMIAPGDSTVSEQPLGRNPSAIVRQEGVAVAAAVPGALLPAESPANQDPPQTFPRSPTEDAMRSVSMATVDAETQCLLSDVLLLMQNRLLELALKDAHRDCIRSSVAEFAENLPKTAAVPDAAATQVARTPQTPHDIPTPKIEVPNVVAPAVIPESLPAPVVPVAVVPAEVPIVQAAITGLKRSRTDLEGVVDEEVDELLDRSVKRRKIPPPSLPTSTTFVHSATQLDPQGRRKSILIMTVDPTFTVRRRAMKRPMKVDELGYWIENDESLAGSFDMDWTEPEETGTVPDISDDEEEDEMPGVHEHASRLRGMTVAECRSGQKRFIPSFDASKIRKSLSLSRHLGFRRKRIIRGLSGDVSILSKRAKKLKFARSPIHEWGLFALESVRVNEFVVQYLGEVIRSPIAELREKKYTKFGIGSSYLFRIDDRFVIDATLKGGIARFINHSCDPNCFAKVVFEGGQPRVVIYALKDIGIGEEVTYDYKFPYEEEKIPCNCGSEKCRGSLN